MNEILKKAEIKLNQNLWVLVVSLTSLGLSEYFKLPSLLCISKWLGWASAISMLICLAFYTVQYCRNKIKKFKAD